MIILELVVMQRERRIRSKYSLETMKYDGGHTISLLNLQLIKLSGYISFHDDNTCISFGKKIFKVC